MGFDHRFPQRLGKGHPSLRQLQPHCPPAAVEWAPERCRNGAVALTGQESGQTAGLKKGGEIVTCTSCVYMFVFFIMYISIYICIYIYVCVYVRI